MDQLYSSPVYTSVVKVEIPSSQASAGPLTISPGMVLSGRLREADSQSSPSICMTLSS